MRSVTRTTSVIAAAAFALAACAVDGEGGDPLDDVGGSDDATVEDTDGGMDDGGGMY